jgi:hypothetical protein
MAETSLLYKATLATIDKIVVDASLSETHDITCQITEDNVETGSPISDHVQRMPDRLTMVAFFSNAPLSREQKQRVVESQGFQFTTTAEQEDAAQLGTVFSQGAIGYAETVYSRLEELIGVPITVVTGLKTYSDMLIESMSAPRSAGIGDALEVTVTFKHVRFVTNRVFEEQKGETPRTAKKAKLGKQVTKPVDGKSDWRKDLGNSMKRAGSGFLKNLGGG